MRLIDADWVLEHIKPYERSDEKWSVTGGTAIRLIHNAINNAPTAHAVKVTRCKDCRFLIERADGSLGCYRNFMDYTEPENFCSYGEPKEECENGRND